MQADKNAQDPSTKRRLFGGAMIAAAALGPLLLVNALYSQQAMRDAAKALLRQEAAAWARAVRAHFFRLREPPSPQALVALLEASQDEGLRYVGFFGFHQRVEAGTPLGSVDTDVSSASGPEPEGAVPWVGDRVRFRFGAPPERRGRDRMGGDWRPRGPDGGSHRRALFVVEFEPRGYVRLLSDARRTMVLGVVTSVTVVLLAAWAWGAMRRRQVLEARAARAQHLATLGEMSAVLAHEIRNPLASLKGHAQLLVESLGSPGLERPAAKATRVVDDAVRIERITTDLLDFVREGELAKEATDLGALVKLAVTEVVPAERLRLAVPPEPLLRKVDAGRLRQVIENLARNAVQAGEGPVQITIQADNGSARITVRDHGPGIAPGQEERIFEPFVTTRTRGTGLGLAIARRITERHGGRLTGRNHPEGGAIFELTLPDGAR